MSTSHVWRPCSKMLEWMRQYDRFIGTWKGATMINLVSSLQRNLSVGVVLPCSVPRFSAQTIWSSDLALAALDKNDRLTMLCLCFKSSSTRRTVTTHTLNMSSVSKFGTFWRRPPFSTRKSHWFSIAQVSRCMGPPKSPRLVSQKRVPYPCTQLVNIARRPLERSAPMDPHLAACAAPVEKVIFVDVDGAPWSNF